MMEQLRGIYGVIIHPKRTMLALPENRLCLLAIVAPLYFGIGRTFRFLMHFTWLSTDLMKFVFAVILTALLILLGSWIFQQILVLFRKRMTIIKLLNIYGYALVPRFVVAGIAYLLMLSNPSLFSQVGNSGFLALLALDGVGLIYTLILFFYGVGVCLSQNKTTANNGMHRIANRSGSR